MTELHFGLKHWCIWQSELIKAEQTWKNGEVLAQTDLSFLPMLQKRRLSPLAKAACAVAWQCRKLAGEMPVIFFSEHGESHYYFEILNELAKGEGVSPSRFSFAVHNAIAGQFSIQTQSLAPYLCLAGGTEGIFAAYIEAAGLLLEVPEVMIVCYDQPLPVPYQAYTSSSFNTWALAMVLNRDSDYRLSLKRQPNNTTAAQTSETWLNVILSNQTEGCINLKNSAWYWSLNHEQAR